MVSIDQEAVRQLQGVCNFCADTTITGLNVAMLFQQLEEAKAKRQWPPEEAKKFKKKLLNALSHLADFMYMDGAKIEITIPTTKSFIKPPDMRITARVTYGLEDQITFFVEVPDDIKKLGQYKKHNLYNFPLITYKIIELISRLPKNMLKICNATGCCNPFISNHMNKIYCSPRCRSRENIYATRQRQKEQLKDAD